MSPLLALSGPTGCVFVCFRSKADKVGGFPKRD
jgi:hypothetical protein